jgi:hypothetical protein
MRCSNWVKMRFLGALAGLHESEHSRPPICIDTRDEKFQWTSSAAGVMFDVRGDGKPVRIAWTASGSKDAFLALDRTPNGKIDDGIELFENYKQQPKSSTHGFLALAEFDKPEHGGCRRHNR